MKLFNNPFVTYLIGVALGVLLTLSATPKEPVKECYKQTTDSKTMLHRIKCEVE